MKLKKILFALAAIVTVETASAAAITSSAPVQAKTSNAFFPKKIRGTWYRYDSDSNKVTKEIFTKKQRISYDDQGKKILASLHPKQGKKKIDPMFTKKKNNWAVIAGYPRAHGRKWLNVQG